MQRLTYNNIQDYKLTYDDIHEHNLKELRDSEWGLEEKTK